MFSAVVPTNSISGSAHFETVTQTHLYAGPGPNFLRIVTQQVRNDRQSTSTSRTHKFELRAPSMASLVASSSSEPVQNDVGIETEDFTIELQGGKQVIGNLIVMDQSCYVWLGNADDQPSMNSLATAIPSRFEAVPISTSLLINDEDDAGCDMAQRLAQRFNIQVFVSCNVSTTLLDSQRHDIDKRLIELFGRHFAKKS